LCKKPIELSEIVDKLHTCKDGINVEITQLNNTQAKSFSENPSNNIIGNPKNIFSMRASIPRIIKCEFCNTNDVDVSSGVWKICSNSSDGIFSGFPLLSQHGCCEECGRKSEKTRRKMKVKRY